MHAIQTNQHIRTTPIHHTTNTLYTPTHHTTNTSHHQHITPPTQGGRVALQQLAVVAGPLVFSLNLGVWAHMVGAYNPCGAPPAPAAALPAASPPGHMDGHVVHIAPPVPQAAPAADIQVGGCFIFLSIHTPTRTTSTPPPQSLLCCLECTTIIIPCIHTTLVPTITTILPALCSCTHHPAAAVQHAAAAAVAAIMQVHYATLLPPLLASLLPLLDLSSGPGGAGIGGGRHGNGGQTTTTAAFTASVGGQVLPDALTTPTMTQQHVVPHTGAARMGAMQMVQAVVQAMGTSIAPYSILLIMPVLRCMTDTQESVRHMAAKVCVWGWTWFGVVWCGVWGDVVFGGDAHHIITTPKHTYVLQIPYHPPFQKHTQAFATIVQLLPLAQGMPPPPALSPEQTTAWQQDHRFLDSLLDNQSAEAVQLPFELTVQLRPYQQEGINWLAFLRRSGLHGILAVCLVGGEGEGDGCGS